MTSGRTAVAQSAPVRVRLRSRAPPTRASSARRTTRSRSGASGVSSLGLSPAAAIASAVAVHGDAAHVHQPRPARGGGGDRVARAVDVRPTKRLPSAARRVTAAAVWKMTSQPARRARESRRLEHVAGDELRRRRARARRARAASRTSARTRQPSRCSRSHDVRADEPRRAGHERRGHARLSAKGSDGDVDVDARARRARRRLAPFAGQRAIERRAGLHFAPHHRERDAAEPRRAHRAAHVADLRAGVVVQRRAARQRLRCPRRARRAGACSRGRGSARAPPSPARRSSPSCTRSRAARRSSLPAGSSMSSMSIPHSGRPASTRAISHASRPAGVAPAATARSQSVGERFGRHDQLESFDPELGDARDEQRARRRCSHAHVRVRRAARSSAGAWTPVMRAHDVPRVRAEDAEVAQRGARRRRAARYADSRTSSPSPPTLAPARGGASTSTAPSSTNTRTSATIFPFAVSAAA